jgi:hypothetical protein
MSIATIAAVGTLVTTLLVPLLQSTAMAQEAMVYPWCDGSGRECAYTSYAQCRQTFWICQANPAYDHSAHFAHPDPMTERHH